MDISFFQAYPFDLPCSRAFNGDGENNAVEFSNKRMMVKVSDESKKKQRGSRVCSRGHWRVSEDSQLTELVSVHGPQNWNHIAEKMQGRTGKNQSFLCYFYQEVNLKCFFSCFFGLLKARVAD